MKVMLFANTDWYLFNFRSSLANALRESGHDVVFLCPYGPYVDRLQSLGFRTLVVPLKRRSLNPFREAALVLWLWRLIRREEPDVIHGFTMKSAIYAALAARTTNRTSRVASIAGLGYVFVNDDARARLLRPLIRWLISVAFGGERFRLILQNPDDVSEISKFRIVEEGTIRLIYGSGVDCGKFTAVDPTGKKRVVGNRLRVLLAARLLWDKGLQEYIDAARRLLRMGVDVEFLLAGKPDPGESSGGMRRACI